VTAIVALGAVVVVPAAASIPTGPFAGDLGASVQVQTGTVAVASAATCNPSASSSNPAGGTPQFVSFTFVNDTGSDVCETVNFSTLPAANVMVAAYSGSFDATNPSTNFLGASVTTASCAGASGTFKFPVSAGATFVIVVSECTPGSGGQFSFTLTTQVKAITLGFAKTADAATVTGGSQAGFKVELDNAGIVDFTGVLFTDPLPAGPGLDWSLAGDSGPEWAISGAPPTQSLTYTTNFLAAETSTIAHVISNTTFESCGTYVNKADVTVSGSLALASGSSSATITVTSCVRPPTSTAGFACDPHGTTGGSPTTKLSAVTVDYASPSDSRLTCFFRGTTLPLSVGGTCRYEDAGVRVDFRRRILVSFNGSSYLTCSGATITTKTDLRITKTDGLTSLTAGGQTTYTITVTNDGPNPVTGATVSDTFPGGLTAVTYTSAAAGGASGNTATGSGGISDTVALPAGASLTYTALANVADAATGPISNTATVTMPAGMIDTDPANNTATDVDTVPADLVVTLDDQATSINAGAQNSWRATVTNSGPNTALNATLTMTLDVGDGAVTESHTIGPFTMAVGQSIALVVTIQVPGSATGTAVVTASGTSDTFDPNPANNTVTDTDTINPT
jgi:uncharacterized repeat protein (TIGR01451 family)